MSSWPSRALSMVENQTHTQTKERALFVQVPRDETSVNKRAHWSSPVIGFLLLVIGLTEPLRSLIVDYLPVPRFVPPSWQVIYMVPGFEWLYTVFWAIAGVVAFLGLRDPEFLRWGFRFASLLSLSWALAGVPAIILSLGGNVQGSAQNMICAIVLWLVSDYVPVGTRSDRSELEATRTQSVMTEVRESLDATK